MQTLIDIEETQLKKLLFYTHSSNGTEAVAKIINDYLVQQQQPNNQQLLHSIQQRFASIPKEINLADELIEQRHNEALQELI